MSLQKTQLGNVEVRDRPIGHTRFDPPKRVLATPSELARDGVRTVTGRPKEARDDMRTTSVDEFRDAPVADIVEARSRQWEPLRCQVLTFGAKSSQPASHGLTVCP